MKSILIAVFLFASLFGAAGTVSADNSEKNDDKKVWICHHNNGTNEYVLTEISENALDAHLKHQDGEDIYPVPEGGCPTAAVVTPEPAPVETAVPTETAPVVTPVPNNPDVTPTPQEGVTTPNAPNATEAPQTPVTTQAGAQAQTDVEVQLLPSTGSGTESNELVQYIALGVASLMFAGTGLAALRKE